MGYQILFWAVSEKIWGTADSLLEEGAIAEIGVILGGGQGQKKGNGYVFGSIVSIKLCQQMMTYQILCRAFSERIWGTPNSSLEEGAIAEVVV